MCTNGARTYKPADKMSDLICDNYALLQVLSRFGVALGFGDKSVKEVCEMNQVDCDTFLIVVNFLCEDGNRIQDHLKGLSIPALMDYLKRAHHYFLDFQLPTIRRKLIEAIDCSQENEVACLIIKFFDAYVHEVRKHMEYENEKVFVYVGRLLEGEKTEGYNIGVFARNHDQINAKLTELKNIIIKYYPGGSRQPASECHAVRHFQLRGRLGLAQPGGRLSVCACHNGTGKGGKMKSQDVIHVAVAESSAIVRGGLASILRRLADVKVQPIEISSKEGLLHCMEAHQLDILIVNPQFEGWFDLDGFRQRYPHADIKFISLIYTVVDSNQLKGYDEAVNLFDDVDSLTHKISVLMNVSGEDEGDASTLSQREKRNSRVRSSRHDE